MAVIGYYLHESMAVIGYYLLESMAVIGYFRQRYKVSQS